MRRLFTTIWMRHSQWVVRRSLKTYLCQALRARVLNYCREVSLLVRQQLSSTEAADVVAIFLKAVAQHMVRAFHVLRVRLADWRT